MEIPFKKDNLKEITKEVAEECKLNKGEEENQRMQT